MKTYTIHCQLSIMGWKILYWREAHRKRQSTWINPLPEKLGQYLMVGDSKKWSAPVLCSEGLEPVDVPRLHGREWMEGLKLDATLIKKTIRGNVAFLTLQVVGEKQVSKDDKMLDRLDGYGHLRYVVGYSDEWREVGTQNDRGDWLACFDFIVFKCRQRGVLVAFHVVVNSDSGGFIETMERDIVPAEDAPFDLPDYWTSIGMDDGVQWHEEEIQSAWRCQKDWESALRKEIERVGGRQ